MCRLSIDVEVKMGWSWKQLEKHTVVTGTRRVYSDEDCSKCGQEIGFTRLPETYRQFMKRFGYGEWDCGLFICVPSHRVKTAMLKYRIMDWKDSVREMLGRDFSFILDNEKRKLEEALPLLSEDVRLSRLIEFGGFGNGYCLYWDIDRICSDGDLKVTVANVRDHEVHNFDGTLLEFLGEAMVKDRLSEICGLSRTSWEAKPIFHASAS